MSTKSVCLSVICTALICGIPQAYAAPQLGLPIDCTLGTDCWIVNYMDADPSNAALDYHCGEQTYDGHKGTDIAIRDLVTMEKGVNVLAAADGKVLRLRDGMDDKILGREELEKIKHVDRGCGNGVYIDHGEGWQTIYCHMKKGSVTVTQGQNIKKGDKIGLVGHSGVVEFPHIHIGVFFEGAPIDPFTGHDDSEGCHVTANPLWDKAANISPTPFSIYTTGFTNHIPDFDAIKIDASSPSSLPLDSKALIFWAAVFGIRQGDQVEIEIFDPIGRLFTKRTFTQDNTRARQFYYTGKRTTNTPLATGTYKGEIQISRNMDNDMITQQKDFTIQVK